MREVVYKPLPKPRSGESTSAYISRCISFVNDEGTTGAQAVAMCYSQARAAGRNVPKKKAEIQAFLFDAGVEFGDDVLKLIEEEDVPEEVMPQQPPSLVAEMIDIEDMAEAPLDRPLPSAVTGSYPELDESEPLPVHLRSREHRPDEFEEELKRP
uniref:Uncharacterized protein n=1 Tax=viral metagenome TaxID=1070528 RepID=A0A6M3MBI7_9ZZZZ